MSRKNDSNKKIFEQDFWGHGLPPGPLHAFLTWASNREKLDGWLWSYDKLAETSIGMMRSEVERRWLTTYLRRQFAGRLTPSLEQIMGSAVDCACVEDLTRVHEKLTSLYGSQVGERKRTRRDLKKYGGPPDILEKEMDWGMSTQSTGAAPIWSREWQGTLWKVAMQEFPVEHLYILKVDKKPIGEFDDWPKGWSRDEKI